MFHRIKDLGSRIKGIKQLLPAVISNESRQLVFTSSVLGARRYRKCAAFPPTFRIPHYIQEPRAVMPESRLPARSALLPAAEVPTGNPRPLQDHARTQSLFRQSIIKKCEAFPPQLSIVHCQLSIARLRRAPNPVGCRQKRKKPLQPPPGCAKISYYTYHKGAFLWTARQRENC